ncbi:MAG TPA: HAMP domain-containing sensor histidine kinase [Candidatus Binatia bacterium]|nr:HAMP domain-containing sensor histidine kinase [Candidatus Binatia bacterium]
MHPLGFSARLGLATSVLVAFVCIAQSVILTQRDLEHMRRHLAERGEAAAHHVARGAVTRMTSGGIEALAQLCEQVRFESDVVSCRIFNRHGLLLASVGEPTSGLAPPLGQVGPMVVPPDRWELVAPIGAEGRVVIGMSTASLDALWSQRLTTATWGTALFTLVGVLAALILARVLTRPLASLAAAADEIAAGDLTARVSVATRDEIGRLAQSFNAMAESVARNRVALEGQVDELQEANRLKSEFVATMSHELRTPLNVILGYAEMLADAAADRLSDDERSMLAAMRHYSELQLHLVTDVLDFARLSSGRVTVRSERFDLAPLLTDLQVLYRPELRRRHLALGVMIAPDLPLLETDRTKVQEIVRNLVDNAVKFVDQGAVTVSARRAANPGSVVIEVADTGPGVPPDEMQHVFEPFRQVGASSTRATGGVGLGLTIVKQLVDVLGGSVHLESRLGEGTTFEVTLPCRFPTLDTRDRQRAA